MSDVLRNTIDDIDSSLTPKPIFVGVSSCLLGEKVRYDTGHKHHSYITDTLGKYFQFRPFCPEMAIGLGTPRETLRLVLLADGIHCVGNKTSGLDVTGQLTDAANDQREWHQDLCGYILKKDSPSCGMERVKLYRGSAPERKGSGIYAQVLMNNFPNLPIEEEGRLGDPVLRENFIKRVFAMSHWKEVEASGLSIKKLTDFHAQYKFILMSHDQNFARQLGNRLANCHKEPIADTSRWYFGEFMSILKIKATRKNHVNVLQHLQGFLKDHLDKDDKRELSEIFESYRLGRLPIVVPLTLLKHHFRRHPNSFIEQSKYLEPHPAELMLLNTL